jgi:hypothetical protein
MFHKPVSFGRVVGLSVWLALAFNSPAQANDCGGNAPCRCGDNLVASRRLLSGVDPIVAATCTGNGLIINTPGVVLDLNGNKLRGSGKGVGILITADKVVIEDGRVDKFATGIGTGSDPGSAGTTNGSRIQAIRPNENTGHGVLLKGDGNQLIGILAKRSGINGVTVIGNHNLFEEHNDEYNGFHGLFVQGDFNELVNNRVSENAKSRVAGDGIHVEGDNNTIDGSDVTKLNVNGIVVTGNGNVLTDNSVTRQKGDGIVVNGNNNVLTENLSSGNRGFGIIAEGAGNPAASRENRVSINRNQPQCRIYGVTTPPTCIQETL